MEDEKPNAGTSLMTNTEVIQARAKQQMQEAENNNENGMQWKTFEEIIFLFRKALNYG